MNVLPFWSKIIIYDSVIVQEEDEPMNNMIEKVKNVAKGIVATFKKIKKAVEFFMTQVRNGCGYNNFGFDCCSNCVDHAKNCCKFLCEMV